MKKIVYCFLFMAVILISKSAIAQDLTTGLKLHYTFDNATAAKVTDLSGNGLDGILMGNATYAAGYTGLSIELTNVVDYVKMPNNINTNMTDFTFACWINLNSLQQWGRVFDIGNDLQINCFLCYSSGYMRFMLTHDGMLREQGVISSINAVSNTWTHVAITCKYDTATSIGIAILYIDGVEVGRNEAMTNTLTDMGTTSQNFLGKSQYQDPTLDGRIDDFRIYSRALTIDDISLLKGTMLEAGRYKTIVCGGTVQLDTARTNYTGSDALKYRWTPSTGLDNDTIPNPTATVTEETTYHLTLTNSNGCIATDSITVGVIPLTVDAGLDKAIIYGGTVQLDTAKTNYTGNSILKYRWTPSTGLDNDTVPNPTVSVTETTTFYLTVTTPTGCSTSDSITFFVSPLTANAGTDKSMVCGGSIQLGPVSTNYSGTGHLRYKWTPSNDLDNDTIPNPFCYAKETTNYLVTVTPPYGPMATDSMVLNVSPLIATACKDLTIQCGNSTPLSVTTNYSGRGMLRYKWSPSIGLSNDTIANPIASPFELTNYSVTVSTPNNCSATDGVTVSQTPLGRPEIGIVSTNENNKNLIIWNKAESNAIFSYNIYRQTDVTNIFEKIGTVPYTSLNVFYDTLSLPHVQSYTYKVSLLDKCGFETELSNPHKTMHLTINMGMNNTWNLIWEAYVGFTVSTYKVYRGVSSDNLTLIGSAAGNNTQYSDFSAPIGYVYYQVEVVCPNTIITKLLKQNLSQKSSTNILASYNTSKSNIATNNVGLDKIKNSNNLFSFYPNPCKDEVVIKMNEKITGKMVLKLYDMMGRMLNLIPVLQNDQILRTKELNDGVYLLEIRSGDVVQREKLFIIR